MGIDFITPKGFAERTKLSLSTAYKLVKTGELSASKVGGRIRISLEAYKAYCEKTRIN